MATTVKASNPFTEQVKQYLDNLASTDPLFAKTYQKEGKTLEECVKYIMTTVQKSGINGFADSEIYGMAVHYYDEDGLKVDKAPANMRVVVNHVVELSQEEKDEAHKKAVDKAIAEAQAKITNKKPVKKPVNTDQQQASLF